MLITLNGSGKDNKVMPIDLYHAIVMEDIIDLIVIEKNCYEKNNSKILRNK